MREIAAIVRRSPSSENMTIVQLTVDGCLGTSEPAPRFPRPRTVTTSAAYRISMRLGAFEHVGGLAAKTNAD